MKIFRGFDNATGIIKPVVTTGSFDGVHIGHKAIINRLRTLAARTGGESVLITFHPHPRKVLYPDTAGKDLKLINSQEEKMLLLERAGVDNIIIIEFTREFSRITSEEFVRDYLAGRLRSRIIVAGFNHHFGFNKEGDYRQLWNWRDKYGFDAEEIPEQEVEHESVSSTRIRKAISEGYIQRANAYLDHHYLIIATPVPDKEFGSLDIPGLMRIPVTDEDKLLPPDGIYAVTVDKGTSRLKGMVIIYSRQDEKTTVLLWTSATGILKENMKISLLFQKKITGRVDLENTHAALPRIRSSFDEISELIY